MPLCANARKVIRCQVKAIITRRIIATRVRMKRAATTKQLSEIGAALGASVIEEAAIGHALVRAERLARSGETVVVAGSLYLVGAVRKRLLASRKAHPCLFSFLGSPIAMNS